MREAQTERQRRRHKRGSHLSRHAEVWVAKRIRDPCSPDRQQWVRKIPPRLMIRRQRLKSKYLAAIYIRGGICGLIRYNAHNLTTL